MYKVKILQVSKGEYYLGYYGGLSPNKTVMIVKEPLKAERFEIKEVWYQEKELIEAESIITKCGFTIEAMILEYDIYKA